MTVRSGTHFAELLSQRFNYFVGKKDVSDWIHGRKLPEGAPPFPIPSANHTWNNADEGIAWFERWVYKAVKENVNSNGDLASRAKIAEMQKKLDEGALATIKLEREQRAIDSNYILWADAIQWAAGIGAEINSMLNQFQDAFPARAAGKTEVEIKSLCAAWVEGAKSTIAQRQNERI